MHVDGGGWQVDMGEIYIVPEGAAEVHIGPFPPLFLYAGVRSL